MKLINYDLENEIDFNISNAWSLICEHSAMFTSFTGDMCMQVKGQQGKWRLISGGKDIDFAKYAVYLADYHNMNLNDKKATAILQDNLKKLAFDENHIVATNELLTSLTMYFNDLTLDIDYPLTVRDADITILLKAISVAFLEEYDNLFEKLCDYVSLLSRLTSIKVIVCISLRSYLNSEQLSLLFKHCQINGISILCIDSSFKTKIKDEAIIVYDEDRCEYLPVMQTD